VCSPHERDKKQKTNVVQKTKVSHTHTHTHISSVLPVNYPSPSLRLDVRGYRSRRFHVQSRQHAGHVQRSGHSHLEAHLQLQVLVLPSRGLTTLRVIISGSSPHRLYNLHSVLLLKRSARAARCQACSLSCANCQLLLCVLRQRENIRRWDARARCRETSHTPQRIMSVGLVLQSVN
jgi:hypothetical protein